MAHVGRVLAAGRFEEPFCAGMGLDDADIGFESEDLVT
jgi:hypothetical protein